MRTTTHNFWLDVAIFAGYLATIVTGVVLWRIIPHAVEASVVGLSRQVWLAAHLGGGMFSLAGVGLHVVWHWDWLKALRGRPLRTMPTKVRANRVVDRVLWQCFIAATVWGTVTTALRLSGASAEVTLPERLHVVSGVAWAVLTIVHLGLHWKWIAATARRCLAGGWQNAKALPQQSP